MDNIYIKALEIGTNNIDVGISYYEIVKELDLKFKGSRSKDNFRLWFYSNFYHVYTQQNLNRKEINLPDELDNMKSILSGEAYMKYLDYIELKEARQSAATAKTIAIISIIIAIISNVGQILMK